MTEQEKLEYTKFVLDKVAEHLVEGGTYRKLIYDRLGFTPESGAYTELISGLAISNAFCKLEELDDLQDIVFKIRKITNEIPAEWSNCETSYIKRIEDELKRVDGYEK